MLAEAAAVAERIGGAVDDGESPANADLARWSELTGQPLAPSHFAGVWRSMEYEEFAAHALVARCAPAPAAPSREVQVEMIRRMQTYDPAPGDWHPGVSMSAVWWSWFGAWTGDRAFMDLINWPEREMTPEEVLEKALERGSS